jgi:hypothetical protein
LREREKIDPKKKFVERKVVESLYREEVISQYICIEMSVKMYREITNLSIDITEVSIRSIFTIYIEESAKTEKFIEIY